MKAKKMRELTDEELAKKVSDYKEELFNLRFQAATGQLDNPTADSGRAQEHCQM